MFKFKSKLKNYWNNNRNYRCNNKCLGWFKTNTYIRDTEISQTKWKKAAQHFMDSSQHILLYAIKIHKTKFDFHFSYTHFKLTNLYTLTLIY